MLCVESHFTAIRWGSLFLSRKRAGTLWTGHVGRVSEGARDTVGGASARPVVWGGACSRRRSAGRDPVGPVCARGVRLRSRSEPRAGRERLLVRIRRQHRCRQRRAEQLHGRARSAGLTPAVRQRRVGRGRAPDARQPPGASSRSRSAAVPSMRAIRTFRGGRRRWGMAA